MSWAHWKRSLPQSVEKVDGAILTGLDPLFVVTGGLIRAWIVGHVTTLVVGASNLRLQHVTVAPAATVNLNVGAVAVDDDAVGTIYYNVGATGVFTPTGGLGFLIEDPVTVAETCYLLAPGTVYCLGSAARAGNIKWYMNFIPLGPGATVTPAA
jgi:hypothetical protein